MAKKLTGSEPVTDALLTHISGHVFPAARKQFALRHLKLEDAQYDNIEHEARYSGRTNYEVNNKNPPTKHSFPLILAHVSLLK